VKMQSTGVEGDRFLEVYDVSIANRSALDLNDFAVDALGHAAGDPASAERNDVRSHGNRCWQSLQPKLASRAQSRI